MKNVRRIIPAVLVFTLLVLSFTACGSTPAGSQQASDTVAASSGPAASTAAEPAAANSQMPDKLVIVCNSGTPLGTDQPDKQKAFIDAVKKATGVTLEINNNQQGDTYVATKIAAGEQVDIYMGNQNQLFLQNAIVPVEKSWIDNSTYIKKIPQMYWANFTKKGKIIAVPFRSMMRSVMFIRQDWLDKLNLKAPTTLDDFYTVSKAFATQDPDGNGKQDTYGYSASNQWNSITYFFYPIQAALCKYVGEFAFDTDQKKLVYVPFQEDYKQYLTYIQKSYKEKIIDQEIFTNQHENMLNNFYSGKTGILVYFVQNADEIVAKTTAVNPNAKVTAIAPPSGPAGKGFYAMTSDVSYGILKTTKDPQATFRFLDWIHSPDGTQMWVYGPEGVNWKNDNGKPTPTVDNYTMGLSPFLVILQDQFKPLFATSDLVKNSIALNEANLKYDNASPVAPVNPKADQLMTLFQEYYAKIVTGKLDVDNGVKEWQQQFTAKGFQQYFDDANKDTSWAVTP